MKNYTKADIIRMVDEEDVEFIRLQFTDIYGTLKNTAITKAQLLFALEGECRFDGSSIEGFARIEESDMYLKPILNSFVIFPWRPQQGKVARLLCDICTVDGTPFAGDPRGVLKRALESAAKEGYTLMTGPELEFFLFDLDEEGQPTTRSAEKAGYFDIGPADYGENARRDMVLTLEDMGFKVTGSHHELAPAQHEIDFMYDEALQSADNVMTYKMAVRTIAKRHGLHATFMPKPRQGIIGSGMHTNVALFKDGKNAFYDENDENGLSKEAYYFMGGIIKHVAALTALTNPLVNSYKRLVPGYDAPVYIGWSSVNRSPMIRVPQTRMSDKKIELRFPDPSANPYLAFTAILEAGLDGIRNKIMPPARIDENIFSMSEAEREERGIKALPGSLKEAIAALEADELIKNALGEYVAKKYIQAKQDEIRRYDEYVSQWEIEEYLAKN